MFIPRTKNSLKCWRIQKQMASFKLLRQWKIHAAPSIWDKKNSFQGYRTFESLFGREYGFYHGAFLGRHVQESEQAIASIFNSFFFILP